MLPWLPYSQRLWSLFSPERKSYQSGLLRCQLQPDLRPRRLQSPLQLLWSLP